jgi:alpha-tubulin suppressor-like RCC1 family protein
LGLNDANDRYAPTLIPGHTGITDIASSYYHSLFVKDGKAYSFGDNSNGKLGDGSNSQKNSPTLMNGQNFIVTNVYAGYQHSVLVTESGVVYSVGANNRGQLGDDTNIAKSQIVPLYNQNYKVFKVAAGSEFTAIITTSGRLYTFGRNDVILLNLIFQQGQLGGQVTAGNSLRPVLSSFYPIMDVAAGEKFTIILESNFTCEGKLPKDPSICLGRGICTFFNTCSCDPDYSGNNCQYYSCFRISAVDPTVCSGRGTCVASNNCTCVPKSSGTKCENFECFGKDSKVGDVCSSKGICQSIDNCLCNTRYLGSNCQTFIRKKLNY